MPAPEPNTTSATSNLAESFTSPEELLLQQGLLTPEQYEEIKQEHINTGQAIEDLILARGYVNPLTFNQAKAKVLDLAYVEVNGLEVPSFILNFIPETLAAKYLVLPFKEEGASLHVAMADPLDLQVIAIVEKKSGMRVKPYLADKTNLGYAIQQQYSKAFGSEVSEALKEVGQLTLKPTKLDTLEGTELKSLENAPVARIVGQILQYAVRSGASDVHIEPGEDKTRVRYRVDGVMSEKLSLPLTVHANLVSRVKILSNLKIDEKRLPQDGRFKVQVGTTIIDLRVSTLPTVYGEKVVMRLLEGAGRVMGIQELGMRGSALKRFEASLSKTLGMILVTGPTGSGKTNTLASGLARVNTIKVNVITLEDPVEIRIPGANQVQINHTAGLTFASGLRSILRQDPDIIMVGEIRDQETAELAVHASLTGHLVFSTLHTKSAAGALPRLYDMKVEPFLLASTVNLVMAQRLVRTLCNKCKQPYVPSDEVKADISTVLGAYLSLDLSKLQLYKPVGCSECGSEGYAGRTGIFEVLEVTPRIGRAIIQRQPEGELQKIAVEEGMLPLLLDGYLKVVDGTTTIEEVLRVAKD